MKGTKHQIDTYPLPEKCFVSQIDNRGVGIFVRETKVLLKKIEIPAHIDCRDWSWWVNPEGHIDVSYIERNV